MTLKYVICDYLGILKVVHQLSVLNESYYLYCTEIMYHCTCLWQLGAALGYVVHVQGRVKKITQRSLFPQ